MSGKQVLLLSLLGAIGTWFLTTIDNRLLGPVSPPAPAVAGSPASSPASIRNSAQRQCHAATVPVALAAGETRRYTVFGELCFPLVKDGRIPTVHLAVHGATYSHLYWRWPYQPEIYSYADHLSAAGYAVFAVDRIGVGRSSHPPGASVTMNVNAFVIHQLVGALRRGSIGKVAFQRVVLVGHSLGSIAALAESSRYQDVDGLVLTGISHFSPGDASLLPSLVRANRDPRFAGRKLDDDYLTTSPGSRAANFLYSPSSDPRLLALDEAIKETVTTAELKTSVPVLLSGASFAIRVPVLLIAGQFDPGICGSAPICASTAASAAAFEASERPFFAPEACLQTIIIPDAGPDLNLEPSAPDMYAAIRAWSGAYIGLRQAARPCSEHVRPGSDGIREAHLQRMAASHVGSVDSGTARHPR